MLFLGFFFGLFGLGHSIEITGNVVRSPLPHKSKLLEFSGKPTLAILVEIWSTWYQEISSKVTLECWIRFGVSLTAKANPEFQATSGSSSQHGAAATCPASPELKWEASQLYTLSFKSTKKQFLIINLLKSSVLKSVSAGTLISYPKNYFVYQNVTKH